LFGRGTIHDEDQFTIRIITGVNQPPVLLAPVAYEPASGAYERSFAGSLSVHDSLMARAGTTASESLMSVFSTAERKGALVLLDETPVPEGSSGASIAARWLPVMPSEALAVVSMADLAMPHVSLDIPADGQQLRTVRSDITAWLRQLDVGEQQRDDMVLAVCEAVTNAMEHAYPAANRDGAADRVLVLAMTNGTRSMAAVVVVDRGEWRPPGDPGFRGRGLPIMRAVSDGFGLHHDGTGTTVVLRWRLPSN
jgi:anti-sigma regulatory factor (Ser/Thr protein kinase)